MTQPHKIVVLNDTKEVLHSKSKFRFNYKYFCTVSDFLLVFLNGVYFKDFYCDEYSSEIKLGALLI